jgi:hypothetical protein
MMAEHIASRDLWQAIALFHPLGLRSLSGSRRSQKNDRPESFSLPRMTRLFHITPKDSPMLAT